MPCCPCCARHSTFRLLPIFHTITMPLSSLIDLGPGCAAFGKGGDPNIVFSRLQKNRIWNHEKGMEFFSFRVLLILMFASSRNELRVWLFQTRIWKLCHLILIWRTGQRFWTETILDSFNVILKRFFCTLYFTWMNKELFYLHLVDILLKSSIASGKHLFQKMTDLIC